MNKVAAIIGAGVIGGGWAARFRMTGWQVRLYDPSPDAVAQIERVYQNALASVPQLVDGAMPAEGELVVCGSVEEAVSGATWIQESVPERLEIKQSVFREIQTHCSEDATIGSSTSGFMPSQLQADALRPEQIVVTHPYNPVYLLPLVELVPGAPVSAARIEQAKAILGEIGMHAVHIKKEIDAHVGDRLLEALWREALWLVSDGIATTGEIDDIMTHSFGMRWAQMGLFDTYRVAGGQAGMRHFMEQFGPCLTWPWTKLMDVPEFNDKLVSTIVSQSDAQSGHLTISEMEQIRDRNLVGFLKVLKDNDWAAGKMFNQWLADAPKPVSQVALDQPLALHSARVLPSWVDYNGHMTEFRYSQVLTNASDAILEFVGMDKAYIDTGFSYYTVESHIRHLGECKLNETLTVHSQLIAADDKRMHVYHSIQNERGEEVVTGEHMMLHVDRAANKACPVNEPMKSRLAALLAAQADLPKPTALGRFVGAPR
ncbi:MAG: carnitine 3-dehydrogenase [Gammaproteobacteria bacterium]|nr:carnitine 3-dehydrogenase [Gammaproteobacteria bacterium]